MRDGDAVVKTMSDTSLMLAYDGDDRDSNDGDNGDCSDDATLSSGMTWRASTIAEHEDDGSSPRLSTASRPF